MPLNPPPTIQSGLALVTQKIQRTDSSVVSQVVYAVTTGATPSVAEAQNVADAVFARWKTAYDPGAATEAVSQPCFVRLGDGSTQPYEAIASTAAGVGAKTDAMPPPQIAVLIKKSTGVGGRQNRGRMYLPYSLQEDGVNETGTILGSLLTTLQTAWTAFLAGLQSDGYGMVLANRHFNTPLPPHYVTSVTGSGDVTSLTVEQLCATQRRRLGR